MMDIIQNVSENERLLRHLRGCQDEMVTDLTTLVEMESPSDHKRSLDRLGDLLADRLRLLGAQVEKLAQSEAGDHVFAHWGEDAGGALMLCHMDTVWDLGTVTDRPVRVEIGRAHI